MSKQKQRRKRKYYKRVMVYMERRDSISIEPGFRFGPTGAVQVEKIKPFVLHNLVEPKFVDL